MPPASCRLLAASLLAAAVVAGAGCSASSTRADRGLPRPATASTQLQLDRQPDRAGVTSPAGGASAIPVNFPLAVGLVSDDETEVRGPGDLRGIDLTSVCGLRAWPGPARSRLVVTQVGSESGLIRELVTFHSGKVARAVVSRIGNGVDQCLRPHGSTTGAKGRQLVLASLDGVVRTGRRQSVALAQTLPGDRPGGAILVFVRVGRAVLGVESGGEWTTGSMRHGVRQLVHTDQNLVALMCVFTPHGC